MGKRFSFKKGQPSITEIGKTRDRIVFGFSELRPYSYVDSHTDSGFFISFLDRLKNLVPLIGIRLMSLPVILMAWKR